jgi:hypothetical protein
MLASSLINTPEELDDRVAIRNEFLALGLDQVLVQLKEEESDAELLAQIDTYEKDTEQDDEEFADRISGTKPQNFKDPKELYVSLMDHIKEKKHLYAPFFEVMKQLIVMPTDKARGLRLWLFLAKVAHQLAAQRDEIKFDADKVFDIEEVIASVDDKYELENIKEQNYEAVQKLEIEIDKLKQQVTDAEAKVSSQLLSYAAKQILV